MSLLDFDNDDAGINVTTTTDAGFYGNSTSIDDPFGFDVFGSNSAGSVTTKSGSVDIAKSGNPFDDFDPFGGFGDASTVVMTTSNFSTSSSSFTKPATDEFGFDDFSNNNPTNITETNTRLWGGEDDFHRGGSSLEEPNGIDDVTHDDVIHDDVTRDDHHHQASPEEEMTEVTGDATGSSVFAADAFSSEQKFETSLHSAIATPYFDTTVPILGDSYYKTAPDDVVEDSISTKETESVVVTASRSDFGLVNGKDVPASPETPLAFGVSGNDGMSGEGRFHAGLGAIWKADISDSETPAAASLHTDSHEGFAGGIDFDRKNTKDSNSEWPVHEASCEKETEARISENTEDKVDTWTTGHSKPYEEMSNFQSSPAQDFPVTSLTNHHDVPTADHVNMTSEREIISDESYSFDQDRGRTSDHPMMAEKDNDDDFGYQFEAQPDHHRHNTNSHRGQEENSLADYFSVDDRNRGRISIEEIRQRSYEDMEPLRSASSHDRNQKEQKMTADNKTPSVYVLGAASDSACKVCSKRVYEMEKITADLQVYHKTCFRCVHCSRILSLGNFSTNEGRLYCKPHFMEIFKTKGNYKEGFAAAERNRQQGDRHDASDPEDQQSLNGRSRHSSEENGPSRMRHSSSGRDDEYDEADEEIPVVQIKSVRSMFEKMSQDKSPAAGQPKKAAKTSQAPQSAEKGQWKPAEQVRRDSLRSEGEREERENVSRKGSVGDREVVQSSTVCIVEEELPPPSFTKSMLAKFRMMEDVSGGAKPPNYRKPASSSKQTSSSHGSSTGRHQTLTNRSSSGSESNRHDEDENEATRTSRQHSSAEEQTDGLPQAGHAKSLLAQWRNIEEQSKRGRNREPNKTGSSARRSQSMSRVETVQRASVYRNIDLGSPRSKQAEDIGRSGSYSDQETSEDDAPVSMPTKQSLAKFKQLEGGQSVHETDGSHKAKRKFKWEVKEAVPLNRGGIIVHGDVPRRLTAESADVVRGSEDAADNEDDDYDGRLKRNGVDARREVDVDADNAVHQSVLTVFNEDELPAPATTRTLLQHFKSMEDVTKAPPLPRPSPSEAARGEARSKAASGAIHSDSDYDEGHRNENQKQQFVRSDSEDIQKELDAYEGEELPAQGTTRSLLAKFQSFQTKN